MPISTNFQNFSEIRKMTGIDLRGQKTLFWAQNLRSLFKNVDKLRISSKSDIPLTYKEQNGPDGVGDANHSPWAIVRL